MCAAEPRLYHDFASWWSLLSPPEDYAEEAAIYEQALLEACQFPPTTLLELGSGGGNNAFYLKKRFSLTLVDRSSSMLEQSQKINEECEHIQGDMRTIRLQRLFDLVFVHDAVSYLTTAQELQQAIETAFVHCKAGGAALFAPDYVRENFRPATSHGGCDGVDRALRYLEWVWDPDGEDTTYTVDFAYLLRQEDGTVRVEEDRHLLGLFGRDEWLKFLAEAGFQPQILPFEHSELEAGAHELFLAQKPQSTCSKL